MTAVTICIPAYRSGAFLAHTVRSALAQTHRDIVVDVAIEPPGEEELAACDALLGDPRLRLSVNERVLGWADNIALILARVQTPYFAILPHDDFLHARYVEILLAALAERPDAVVAYGDIQFMNGERLQRRRQVLSEGKVEERLISFLAAGAEAPPWRGVTRTSVLAVGSFPTDAFQGLLVECEWAFHLLACGVAVRAPQTLYFKRLFGEERVTASQARVKTSAERIAAGVEDHRERLLRRAADALQGDDVPPLLRCGVEAVAARRKLDFGQTAFDAEHRRRVRDGLQYCARDDSEYGRQIHAALLLVESRLAEAEGDRAAALDHARLAATACEVNPACHIQIARLLHAQGDRFGALQAIARACDVSPYNIEAQALAASIERAFLDSLRT